MPTDGAWKNLYQDREGRWLRGNLHTHTNRSPDGTFSPEQAIERYRGMGYAYLAITDHNRIFDLPLRRSGMAVLPGIEVDFLGRHHINVVHHDARRIVYGAQLAEQQIIDGNIGNQALVFLNHPNWQLTGHFSFEELERLAGYAGIEIYNGTVEFVTGSALATEKWDFLLSSGRRVLGLATQDSHRARDYRDCCTVVRAKDGDGRTILDALRAGNFYCSCGVEISDIGRAGDRIHVETGNAELVRFIGWGGAVLKDARGRDGEITLTDEPAMRYVRVECHGRGVEAAWSQPFFRD
jgi:hypothetical protein